MKRGVIGNHGDPAEILPEESSVEGKSAESKAISANGSSRKDPSLCRLRLCYLHNYCLLSDATLSEGGYRRDTRAIIRRVFICVRDTAANDRSADTCWRPKTDADDLSAVSSTRFWYFWNNHCARSGKGPALPAPPRADTVFAFGGLSHRSPARSRARIPRVIFGLRRKQPLRDCAARCSAGNVVSLAMVARTKDAVAYIASIRKNR